MNRIQSHIKSKQHFDEIWNNRLDFYSTYFANNLPNSFAYHFRLKNFSNLLLTTVDLNSIDSSTTYASFITRYQSLLSFQNAVDYTSSLDAELSSYFEILVNYEDRRKKIPSVEKLRSFFHDVYLSITPQQKNTIVFPFAVDLVIDFFFADFYPSIQSSIKTFFIKNNLIVHNSKLGITFLKKHNITNEDLEIINKNSLISFDGYSDNVLNNAKVSLDLLFNAVDNLNNDKKFLESKVIELQNKIDKDQKEGFNGYLLTWH